MPNPRPFSAFLDDPDGWREYWSLDQALVSHRDYQAWLAAQCPEPDSDELEPPPETTLELVETEDWATDQEYELYLLAQNLVA